MERSEVRGAGRGVLLLLGATALLSGCVAPNVKVDRARAALSADNQAVALAWGEELKHSHYSKDLGHLESGRIRMLAGDFESSAAEFGQVIDRVIEQSDEGPRIKLGDVGAGVMAGTVTDDRTRPYRLPPYEFIQALGYQMLNRIFLGDLEGAAVEARRAIFAQDQIAEKYGASLDTEQEVAQDQVPGLEKVNTAMEPMQAVVSLARNSYENGFVWWLCGLLLEGEGDRANARLAFQKAYELVPGNRHLQRDWLRMLRHEDPEAFRAALQRENLALEALQGGASEVILIYEEAFVPQRLSHKIPIPVMGTVVSLDFPLYGGELYTPAPLELKAGSAVAEAAVVLNLQALAYRDLKERMPGIVTRNISRAAVRLGASVAARQMTRRSSSANANLIGGAIWIGSALATALNRADTRAWYTLPMTTQVWRGSVEPGEVVVEVTNRQTGCKASLPLHLGAGERHLIWLADDGGQLRAASTTLSSGAVAAKFDKIPTLLQRRR